MVTILNIETATSACSVALAKDGVVIASEENNDGMVHAEKITLLIKNLMEKASFSLHNIDAIAIGTGPGSYTGLRIGTATAKGLCYALDKPLIAVPTLKAMAYGAAQKLKREDVLYCPMIDARRLEVYTALFDHSGKEILPVQAKILDNTSFAEYKTIAFFGDGMPKMKELFANDSNKIWLDSIYASALNMCHMAEEMFASKTFSDVAYYEPFYLKDFVAGKKVTS
ncbi:MAG TPA: tRNA (adenosine(37)-N6)-threonylcarbamoyltransferase complex dimerization subunit type 1 TsaB [Bacteroidia bacterium]|nr:tRNA (adenosine(37)-N6)-threonylcarbamoyltransferase complex dimerization subunit type 1 TsaB [Bacteroidia bacterium]